jgi:hypothetical protein
MSSLHGAAGLESAGVTALKRDRQAGSSSHFLKILSIAASREQPYATLTQNRTATIHIANVG